MKKEELKTSQVFYGKVQTAIDELDKAFFSGKGKEKIPELVFAINNQCRSCVVAFVQADALFDKSNATKLQYMGINPKYLNRKIDDILSTICHELCHVYENAYIHIARNGYHDKKWEELMKDCGLEAKYLNSSKTAVDHKIIKDGAFSDFVEKFKEKYGADYFNIVEYSTEIEKRIKKGLGIEVDEDDDSPKADNADKPVKKYNRNKIKYVCRVCGLKVWGKTGLSISCNDCMETLDEEER